MVDSLHGKLYQLALVLAEVLTVQVSYHIKHANNALPVPHGFLSAFVLVDLTEAVASNATGLVFDVFLQIVAYPFQPRLV